MVYIFLYWSVQTFLCLFTIPDYMKKLVNITPVCLHLSQTFLCLFITLITWINVSIILPCVCSCLTSCLLHWNGFTFDNTQYFSSMYLYCLKMVSSPISIIAFFQCVQPFPCCNKKFIRTAFGRYIPMRRSSSALVYSIHNVTSKRQ